MALSATKKKNSIFGDLRIMIYDLAFTSVTGGVVNTGLHNVIYASYVPTTSDKHGITYKNSSTASETQDDWGDVYIDSVTANDNGTLLVIGN